MPSGSGTSRTISRVKVLSREIILTYLQSVQVYSGEQDAGVIAGEGGGVGTVAASSSQAGSPGFLGMGASGGSSASRTATDSGWVVSRTWKETSFDKVRYGLGIRDIGVFNYLFQPISERVWRPFRSPKPIYKVQLRVVESIPSAYPIDRRYIEYYLSHNDGEEWTRINPLDHPTLIAEDGLVVPRTVTYNPEIGGESDDLTKFVDTGGPVHGIRVRVVIRASQDVGDPDRHTPVLKKFRLLMFPKGGL